MIFRSLFRSNLYRLKKNKAETATKIQKPKRSNSDYKDEFKEVLQAILKEASDKAENRYSLAKLSVLENYKEIKTFEKEKLLQFIEFLILEKKYNRDKYEYYRSSFLVNLTSQLMRVKLDLKQEEVKPLLQLFVNLNASWTGEVPFAPLLLMVERSKEKFGLSNENRELLKNLHRQFIKFNYADGFKLSERINNLLEGESIETTTKITLPKDVVGKLLSEYYKKDHDFWNDLIALYRTTGSKSKPSKKWLLDIKDLSKSKHRHLKNVFISCFNATIELLGEIHKNKDVQPKFLSAAGVDFIRAMVWHSALINDNELSNKVEELGLLCFKKFPGYGAVSVKIGNGTIYAFSILPFKDGIARLTKYRSKIKYSSVLKLIENTILKIAEKEGKTPDEMEEMAVNGFNLINYQYTEQIKDFQAILSINSLHKVDILWKNPKSKIQKTVPDVLKNGAGASVKRIKQKAKEIQTNLSAQKDRIEQFYIRNRKLGYKQWEEFYGKHPLVSYIANKLIWSFSGEDQELILLPGRDGFINSSGNIVSKDLSSYTVELWHPINSSSKEIENWRNFFLSNEIQQPFKQAFREIYIVTDAELETRSYSNRFASHILRQHQFTALCQQRQWRYTLMGQWDSHNTPTRLLPAYNLRAEFWVDMDYDGGTANDMGIFDYIFTDQVRIYSGPDLMDMINVPKIAFSEIMRDVDLFVGVTSIGNDPNWQDSGNEHFNTYWSQYSFKDLNETAKIRKQTLEYLIPKLKIRDNTTVDGNYVVVKGKLRTYKIHIGSGNILMAPNDQYLCIVPDRQKSATNLFLPFEGDQMLSIVLSKALLLADDDKIKDTTITSQINRK